MAPYEYHRQRMQTPDLRTCCTSFRMLVSTDGNCIRCIAIERPKGKVTVIFLRGMLKNFELSTHENHIWQYVKNLDTSICRESFFLIQISHDKTDVVSF